MKRIVRLIDGTWNKEGLGADTNVAKLDSGKKIITQAFIKAIAADGTVQNVRYHDGVGTEGNFAQRVLGGAIGIGLKQIIGEVYESIVDDFSPGDELYLIGCLWGPGTGWSHRCIGDPARKKPKSIRNRVAALSSSTVSASRSSVRRSKRSKGNRELQRVCGTRRVSRYPRDQMRCTVGYPVGSYGIPAGIGLAPLARYVALVSLGFHDLRLFGN